MAKVRLRKKDRKTVVPAGTNKAIYISGGTKRKGKKFSRRKED